VIRATGERAVVALEYAILASLIILPLIFAATRYGDALVAYFDAQTADLGGEVEPAPTP
jgi:Flp pilus assembly pilin Flp